MLISNNPLSFHLWWKENLIKHQKVSKYFETDCRLIQPKNSRDDFNNTVTKYCYQRFAEAVW